MTRQCSWLISMLKREWNNYRYDKWNYRWNKRNLPQHLQHLHLRAASVNVASSPRYVHCCIFIFLSSGVSIIGMLKIQLHNSRFVQGITPDLNSLQSLWQDLSTKMSSVTRDEKTRIRRCSCCSLIKFWTEQVQFGGNRKGHQNGRGSKLRILKSVGFQWQWNHL